MSSCRRPAVDKREMNVGGFARRARQMAQGRLLTHQLVSMAPLTEPTSPSTDALPGRSSLAGRYLVSVVGQFFARLGLLARGAGLGESISSAG
jgi:hypothetical protein